MYPIGSKLGKGRYCCTSCNWQVCLDSDKDRLPPCGRCGKGQRTMYQRC